MLLVVGYSNYCTSNKLVYPDNYGDNMIIKFKYGYSEDKVGNRCIVSEQIQGVVSAIVYQEKVFEVADATTEDIIFDLSGRQYNLTKMKNVQLTMKDTDNKEKNFEIIVNDLTGRWEMNGTTYSSLKELYYDLHLE